MDWTKIRAAVEAIESGIGKRIDLEKVVVYAVGDNMIRIDIKK